MGITRKEYDEQIIKQVELLPPLLKKPEKTIAVPQPMPHPMPLKKKVKLNKPKLNVQLGQRIKRFTGKLLNFHCRFTWEQLEMVKGLSKTMGVSKAEVIRIAVVSLYNSMKAIPLR